MAQCNIGFFKIQWVNFENKHSETLKNILVQQTHLRTHTDTVSVRHQQQNDKDKSRPAAFHTAVTENSDAPWWTWRCSHYTYPATPVHTVWLWGQVQDEFAERATK